MQIGKLATTPDLSAGTLADRNKQSDQLVVEAWRLKRMEDGSKLILNRAVKEQGFVVRDDGIYPLKLRNPGTYTCDNGDVWEGAKISLADIKPHAGGHTHPKGLVSLPGPEDGQLAAATGRPAYIMSERGAFAVDKRDGGYEVRLLAGSRLTTVEKGEISRLVAGWNENNGRSGVKCTFTPD